MHFHLHTDIKNLHSQIGDRITSSEEFKHNKTKVDDFKVTYMGEEIEEEVLENKKRILLHLAASNDQTEAFISQYPSHVFGYSQLMHGAWVNPDFAILQGVKQRLILYPERRTKDVKHLVFLCTSQGLVEVPMEMRIHRNLFPNITLPTLEGLSLIPGDENRKYTFTEKLSNLMDVWNYRGFVFLTTEQYEGQDDILQMSPYPPYPFWNCFSKAYGGNLAKLLWKVFKSRRQLTKLEIEPTLTLKVSMQPYPYTKCPWIPDEKARKFVEGWMTKGAQGIPVPDLKEDPTTDVVWYNVADGKTTGAEVALVSGHSYDDIETRIQTLMMPNLQYKRDAEVMECLKLQEAKL